ncbi:MAG: TRAP transporter small permease [Marinosulfonomonas sp.]|nr:TRAP transporter small permease [Marinosulfonomonas sp.]
MRGAKFLARVSALMLFVMLIHVCIDVASRLLKLPFVGTNETVAAYYMVAIVFLPLPYVALYRQNVTVDLFTNKLSGRASTFTYLIADSLGLFVSVLWLWQATRVALHSTAITERWIIGSGFIQVWPGKWILVLSVAILVLAFARAFIKDVINLWKNQDSEAALDESEML